MKDTEPAIFHWFTIAIYSFTSVLTLFNFYTSNNFHLWFVVGMGVFGLIVYLTPNVVSLKLGSKGDVGINIIKEKNEKQIESIINECINEYIPASFGDPKPIDLDENTKMSLQIIIKIIPKIITEVLK